jgi:hypothetical protein
MIATSTACHSRCKLGTTSLYVPTFFGLTVKYSAKAELAAHYLLCGDSAAPEAMVKDNGYS